MQINISKILITLFLILFLPYCYADETNISCPSFEKIQNDSHLIDTAQSAGDYYVAYTATSAFQEQGLHWYIAVGGISATSVTEAIQKGRVDASNVTFNKNETADKQSDAFICKYGPGRVEAIGRNLGLTSE